jgi:hypothetical protein
MKTLRFIIFCLALSEFAPAQVSISASQIKDSFERPVPTARLCFVPVDATKTPVGFRVGAAQIVPNEVCGTVTVGVLQGGLNVAPTAAGVYYHIYLKQMFSNNILRDYGMTPITGTGWTLDTFDPNVVVLPVTALSVGTVTTLPSGSGASCNITGAGPFLLNCAIPKGDQGPIGTPTSGVNISTTANQALAGPITTATSTHLANGMDLNTVSACGYYEVFSPVNGPAVWASNFIKMQVICTQDPNFITQIAFDRGNATNTSYVRNRTGGTWHPWQLQPVAAGGFSNDLWGTTGPCAVGSPGGSATAGAFISGTTGTCRLNVIMGDLLSNVGGWVCYGSDIDHPANIVTLAGGSTFAVMTVPTTAGDEIIFHCDPL